MFVKSVLNMVSLLVIAGSIGVAFAGSEQKSPYVDVEGYCVVDINLKNQMKFVQQEEISVPDIKGHVVRVFEVQQKISDAKLCNGDSLISRSLYGMTDDIDHDGSLSGYYIYSTAKGDQLFLKVSGNSQKKAGEDLADYQATGRIIGGTGALSGVEGDYQSLAKFNRNKETIKISAHRLRYKSVEKNSEK